MWKTSRPNTGPIVWLGVAAALVGAGCANSTSGAEEALRLRQADSHLNLGLDYIRNGRVAIGLGELLRAERFDPQDARIQLALGSAYLMRNKPAEAEQHLLRTVEIDPTNHVARLNLAILLNQVNRYEESLVHTSILANDPTFPEPWRALAIQGLAEYRLGRLAEARSTLELALDYREDYGPTLLYLGMLEVDEGRQLEGLSLFRQVLAQEPDLEVQAQANYRIGEIYVALGKRERAIGYLRAAVAQNPGGPWGAKSEEYLILLR